MLTDVDSSGCLDAKSEIKPKGEKNEEDKVGVGLRIEFDVAVGIYFTRPCRS